MFAVIFGACCLQHQQCLQEPQCVNIAGWATRLSIDAGLEVDYCGTKALLYGVVIADRNTRFLSLSFVLSIKPRCSQHTKRQPPASSGSLVDGPYREGQTQG